MLDFFKYFRKNIIELLKMYNIDAYSDRKNIGIWVETKKYLQ